MPRHLPALIALGFALALAGCARPERKPAPTPPPLAEATPVQLTVQAGMNETWNAVGQLLVDIFASAGRPVTKPELSALFRQPGHKNFRLCGDQLLRYFLRGLTLRVRGG